MAQPERKATKQKATLDYEGLRLLRGLHELRHSPVLEEHELAHIEAVFVSVCDRCGLDLGTTNDLLDQIGEDAP